MVFCISLCNKTNSASECRGTKPFGAAAASLGLAWIKAVSNSPYFSRGSLPHRDAYCLQSQRFRPPVKTSKSESGLI